jgi:N-acylneuraminate cytidylyltransferase
LRLTAGGGVEPIQPDCIPLRSQDLEEAYHDAGQFYWARAGAFEAGLPVFAHHSIPVVLPRYRVQDIDTLEDWNRAEYMYRAIQLAEAENDADRSSR